MNLHEALARVAEVRERILESQRFRGYSGRARAIGGCIALSGGLVVNLSPPGAMHVFFPLVWAGVFFAAFGLNYGAVLVWWWGLTRAERKTSPLAPALENIPILVVGGALTVHLIAGGHAISLPGVWPLIYGLTHFTAKYAMPRGMRVLGWYYILCGIVLLSMPDLAWSHPWVLGVVFFVGEIVGGLLIFRAHHPGGILSFLAGGRGNADE